MDSAASSALRLAAIVNSSDDAIVSKDLNGVITTWNRAAERMFGYTAAEAVGRSITLIIPDERLDEEKYVLSQIRAGRAVDHFQTVRRRKDGSLLDVSLTVSPIINEAGVIIGASKIARDVTEQMRLAAALEEANRLKDEFLATLSHELRTPLNAVLGYVHMLQGADLPAERRLHALDVIDRNAKILAQLVEDVLDTSRVATGKSRIHVRPADAITILDAALDVIRPAADSKAITLGRHVSRSTAPIVADPDRLQQVFWNLLSNAVKFTPRNGRIEVRLRWTPDQLEVEVSDSGAGISPAFLPFVFQRFRQADARWNREHTGLGLGLALVRHFVELHGGTVTAESEGLGRGATFCVTLPVRAAVEDVKQAVAG
jgi:PAS domain S-box-containing protein